MKRILLVVLLLKALPTFSQTDTIHNNIYWGDTLVYTPKSLMEILMADLNQCDLDRIELKKAKAELTLLYLDYAKKENSITTLKREMKNLQEYNDTLASQNMAMAIETTKEIRKQKRGKRFWASTTFISMLTTIGVHLNWKNSYFEW
jgi:hypothetical protein